MIDLYDLIGQSEDSSFIIIYFFFKNSAFICGKTYEYVIKELRKTYEIMSLNSTARVKSVLKLFEKILTEHH